MPARAFLLFALACAAAAAADLEPMSSAELCGRCHRAIHETWKTSSHAQAMESRLFQDALELAEADFGASARRTCLGCHAPLALQSGDLALARKASWEGVTCDFCHSVREVVFNRGPNPKAILDFALVKTGPLKDSESTGHATEYSAVHSSSKICAPCHEYRNPGGFPVLTTFSEWKNSSYAASGRQCQSCHMSRVSGDVVDPRVKRSSVARINLHQMPGSHSLEQLTSAVKAQLSAARAGGQLQVTVEVANQTAGHYLPTGSPLRQLILEVRADAYSGQHFRQERIYTRRIADQRGTPIVREHFAFLKGARVLADTRLAPGERRTETFTFPAPPNSPAQVNATFWYDYSPTAGKKRIMFLTLNRLVK